MAIYFGDAVGALFTMLGKCGALISDIRSYQASQLATLTNSVSGLTAQLESEPDVQALVGAPYISVLNSFGGVGSLAQTVAQNYLCRIVFRDNPLFGQTLQQNNLSACYREVIRQMFNQGVTVRQTTVSASVQQFNQPTSIGNGMPIVSVYRPVDGRMTENAFTEKLLMLCTADSYLNGLSPFNETLNVTGVGTQSDLFAFNWPLGSNCNATLSAIDGDSDNSSGNILTNSGWENFTQNKPDNWQLVTGINGVNFFEETGIVFDPTGNGKSLRILGDGTEYVWRQQFNSASGTQGTLSPLNQYGTCHWLRRDGIAASGSMIIDLVDSNDIVLTDEAGTACTMTIDLSQLNTEFLPFTAAWRTPQVMPATLYFRFRTTYSAGRSFYLDKSSLGVMTPLESSGLILPWISYHAGSVPNQAGDYDWNTQITNARGAGGTLSTFQTVMALLFPSMAYGQGLLIPSSTDPSIPDSMIA